jgi:hypothetical protein
MKVKENAVCKQRFGVLGYPGRVGVLPEITLFELA